MISKAQKTIGRFTADFTLNEHELRIALRSPTEDYSLAAELRDC
jgi:hypothetical protein